MVIDVALLVAAPFVAHTRVDLLVNSLGIFAAGMWLLADKKKKTALDNRTAEITLRAGRMNR